MLAEGRRKESLGRQQLRTEQKWKKDKTETCQSVGKCKLEVAAQCHHTNTHTHTRTHTHEERGGESVFDFGFLASVGTGYLPSNAT